MLNFKKSCSVKKLQIFISFILVNCGLFAQTLDSYKFFPSSVGNVWEYYIYRSGLNRYEIVSDSLLPDSNKYIYFAPNTEPVYRIDKNYNVYYFPTDSGLNWHYYKLDADSGDHWMVRPETNGVNRWEAQVVNVYPAVFWGYPTIIKVITFYDLPLGDTVISHRAWPRFTKYLGYGIGEMMEFDEEGLGPVKILQGCIIDGDTIGIITSVKDDLFLTNSFELYQNYPNPFNSFTTIKYNIPEPQKVKIIVYSILGEEVKVLVDDYQLAGSHSVVFNAGDLPGGVYIYTIFAGNRTKSKKLILLK